MNLVLFVLSAIGLTNIIVHGLVLDLIRLFGKSVRQWMHTWEWSKQLFSCHECAGFWSGLICGSIIFHGDWYLLPIWGFAGSVVSRTYNDLIDLITSHIVFEVSDEGKQ